MDGFDFPGMAWSQIWQLTLLAIAVMALVRLFGRDRPYLAHTLWLIVLAKSLTLPLWSSPTGLFCWLDAAIAETVVPSRTPPSARRAQPLPAGQWPVRTDVSVDDRLIGHASAAPERIEREAILPPLDRAEINLKEWSGWHLLVMVWLIGFGLASAISAARWLVGWRTIRASSCAPPEELNRLLADLSQRLKLRGHPRLCITGSNIGPAVVGIWRPTIVLPKSLVERLSSQDVEPILAHELIHVRRGDLWIGMLLLIARSLWWFHPLMWLGNRSIEREAERCCDEAAISVLRCDPSRYARSLLNVLELKSRLQPLPAFPGVRVAEVTSQRLERIMNLGHGCRAHAPWWCWAVLLVAVMLTLPGARLLTAKEPKQVDDADRGASTPGAVLSSGEERSLPGDRRVMIELRVISGPPREIAALRADWQVLPVEIPAETALGAGQGKILPHPVLEPAPPIPVPEPARPIGGSAPSGDIRAATKSRTSESPDTRANESADGSADSRSNVVVPASYGTWVSEIVERRLPVMYAVLAEADAEAFQARLGDAKGELVTESNPRLLTMDGDVASIQVSQQRPFVVGMSTDSTGKVDPKVRVVNRGWTIHVRPELKGPERVELDCQIECADVRRVEERTLHLGAQSKHSPFTVQVPEVVTSRLSLCQEVALGKTLLIRGIERRGKDNQLQSTLLMLRCAMAPDEIGGPAAIQKPAPAKPSEPEGPYGASLQQKLEQRVTLNTGNQPLNEVLRNLGHQLQIDIEWDEKKLETVGIQTTH